MSATALAQSIVPATAPSPALALAPLPYYWPRAQVFDFYAAIAATPVELVYLGETVCSRRHELRLADWVELARRLREEARVAVAPGDGFGPRGRGHIRIGLVRDEAVLAELVERLVAFTANR